MAEATFHFPRGFLWGCATSSHQVEGNNTANNWYWWEQQPEKILNGDRSGLACDWWGGRWKEDLDRAQSSGQNAHRLSLEWSRIQPAPDRWDEDALDHYRQIVRGIHARGMTSMVSLHHFSEPLWFMEAGGWENETSIEQFVQYTSRVIEALQEYTNLWVTFNEPNLYVIFGYATGIWPPGKSDLRLATQVAGRVLRAHAAAYRAIHQIQPQSRVGMAHHYRDMLPRRAWSPLDRWVTSLQGAVLNDIFSDGASQGSYKIAGFRTRIPEAKGTTDFLGLNYYTRSLISFNLRMAGELFAEHSFAPGADLSEGGYIANEPAGLERAIHWALRSQVPVIITENGVNDSRDTIRPRYLIQHLHQVWRAVNFNFPIKGYFHWSLVDNFEWERGWSQRFGLWELNTENQMRIKRPSASLYAEICRENGISSETVKRYAPEISNDLFPD